MRNRYTIFYILVMPLASVDAPLYFDYDNGGKLPMARVDLLSHHTQWQQILPVESDEAKTRRPQR